MYKVFYFVFLVVQIACKPSEPQFIKDVNGVITSAPELWKTPLSINNKRVITIGDNAVYSTTVVVSAWNGERYGLAGLDAISGKKLWEWYDDFNNYKLSFFNHSVFGPYLAWQMGRELYCIDMQTGATVFKKRYELDPYLRAVTGNGDDIFIIAESHSPEVEGTPNNVRLYKTTILDNGELTELAQPKNSGIIDLNNNFSNAGGGSIQMVEREGESLILVNTLESAGTANNWNSYINLYNLTTKEWVYEQVLITNKTDSFLQKKPGVWGNFVYLVMNDWVICTDLMTGEIIWERGFTDRTNFATSGYYIAEKEGFLLVNAEANGTTLYALDLETGQQIWQEPSSGTSTEMQYLNGVVYFVGGGDGLLHAVEVETGKHLWKLRSPNDSQGDYFTSYCAVIAGEGDKKGIVIAASGLNAFAYKAER